MNSIKIFGITDVGMVRERNEDSYTVFKTGLMDVVVVADGMGGHIGGRIASSTAVETIRNYFKKNGKKLKIDELIEDSIVLANRKIREKSTDLPPGMSMGTTCTMAVLRGEFCYYGHIGDSKLYHIKKDSISQISTDHTMLQRMLDSGALKPEEAVNFAHKNVIYRSVGGSGKFNVDPTEHFLFKRGEMLLLCSDGLSGYITPSEIFKIVKRTKKIPDAAKYLINLAKFRGGDDNITVIIVEKGKFKREKKGDLEKVPLVKRRFEKNSSGKNRIVIFTLLTILIILLALLGYLVKDKIFLKNVEKTDKAKQVKTKKNDIPKPVILPKESVKKSEDTENKDLKKQGENVKKSDKNIDGEKKIKEKKEIKTKIKKAEGEKNNE